MNQTPITPQDDVPHLSEAARPDHVRREARSGDGPGARGPSRSDDGCRRFRGALSRLEHAPAAHHVSADVTTVREHLARCSLCCTRDGRRAGGVLGVAEICTRSMPSGALDGLYEAVRDRMPYAPIGGGMSAAFLDAPRALRMWRSSAIAAGLLAVGAAFFALDAGKAPAPTPGATAETPRERVLADARDDLLARFATPEEARAALRSLRLQTFFDQRRNAPATLTSATAHRWD